MNSKKRERKEKREMYRSYYVGCFISTPFFINKEKRTTYIQQNYPTSIFIQSLVCDEMHWRHSSCYCYYYTLIFHFFFIVCTIIEVPSYSNYLSLKLILNPVFFADVSHITYNLTNKIVHFLLLLCVLTLFFLTVRGNYRRNRKFPLLIDSFILFLFFSRGSCSIGISEITHF